MAKFKAFIRVVKSIHYESEYSFGSNEFIREPIIEADDKNHVKQILVEKYPQLFQNGKIYERETKDQAQFFYVVIYPLYNYEENEILAGEWICSDCGQVHENIYLSKPTIKDRLLGSELKFCKSEEDTCLKNFLAKKYEGIDMPDDEYHIKKDSPNYIYKITEKLTGKCYIGKTRNAPFFRWWNHLTHSGSPFGLYLSKTKLSEWIFEVLEELPADFPDVEIFRIESEYIIKFDSLNNGFNSLISNKKTLSTHDSNQQFLEL